MAEAIRSTRSKRLGLWLGASVVALGLAPAGALAASTAGVSGSTLEYRGDAAANTVTISGGQGTFAISDSVAINALPGCTPTSATSVTCSGAITRINATGAQGGDTITNSTSTPSTISGGDGADKLNGGGGNDTITGDDQTDTINSGAGNDQIFIDGRFTDFADCGSGTNDRADADATDSVVNCERITGSRTAGLPPSPPGATGGNAGAGGSASSGGIPTQVFPTIRPGACEVRRDLTAGNDTFNGTAQGDLVNALAGDDTVNGLQGDDCLFGFEGRDRLSGSTGDDFLKGDAGNDGLVAGAGNDAVAGDQGNDRMAGDAGRDRMAGGAGRDSVRGGSGSDRISGGSNNDVMTGDANNDRISGDGGNDRISAGSGRNSVFGGSGNDRINVANGQRDRVDCGRGRRDRVRADAADRVRGCERIQRIRRR